jgi:hypothetical protein
VIEVATRKVEIVGIHSDPRETQMLQWARKPGISQTPKTASSRTSSS